MSNKLINTPRSAAENRVAGLTVWPQPARNIILYNTTQHNTQHNTTITHTAHCNLHHQGTTSMMFFRPPAFTRVKNDWWTTMWHIQLHTYDTYICMGMRRSEEYVCWFEGFFFSKPWYLHRGLLSHLFAPFFPLCAGPLAPNPRKKKKHELRYHTAFLLSESNAAKTCGFAVTEVHYDTVQYRTVPYIHMI